MDCPRDRIVRHYIRLGHTQRIWALDPGHLAIIRAIL
jgi:hypothetical protein